MSAKGADSGIKQGEVVEWADPRAELEDIKAEGLRGQQTVDGALARLAEFTRAGRWRELLTEDYATVAEFLAAEFPMLAELAIPQAPRREIVALMAAEETPQKAIAAALGVSPQTVSLDIKITNIGDHDLTSQDTAKRNAGVTPARSANASRQARHRERRRTGQEAHAPDCQCGACQSARPGAYKPPAGPGPVPGRAETVQPGVTGTTIKPPAGPGTPDPEPEPCPRCAPQIAELEQLLADRSAELEKAHARIKKLEEIRPDVLVLAERDALAERVAELEGRRSAAQDDPEQDDPGNDTDEPGSATDGGVCEGCRGPGAPAWSLQGSGARGEHVVCDRCLEKARQKFPGVVFSREELLGATA